MVSAYAQSSKLFEKSFIESRNNVNPTIHRRGTDGETDTNWLNRPVRRPISDAIRPDTVEMPKGYEVSMSQLTDEITSQVSGFQENTPSQESWNKRQRGFNATKKQATYLPSISRPHASSRFQHLATPNRTPLRSICTNESTRILPSRQITSKRKGGVRPWMKSSISTPKPQVPGFTRSTRRLPLSYTPLMPSKNSLNIQDSNGEESDSSQDYSNHSEARSWSLPHALVQKSQSSFPDSEPGAKASKQHVATKEPSLQNKTDNMEVAKQSDVAQLEIMQAKEGALSDMKVKFAKMKEEILKMKSDLDESKAAAINEMAEAKDAHSRDISEVCSRSICDLTNTEEETINKVSTSVKCSIREIREQAEEIKNHTEKNLKVSSENLQTSFIHFLQEKTNSVLCSLLPGRFKKNAVDRAIKGSTPFTLGEMRTIAESSHRERLSICQSNSTVMMNTIKGYDIPRTPNETGKEQSSGESKHQKRGQLSRHYKVNSERNISGNPGNPRKDASICVKSSVNSPGKSYNPVAPQPNGSRKRSEPSVVGSANVEISPQLPTCKRAKNMYKETKIEKMKILAPTRRSTRIRKLENRKTKTKPVTPVTAKRGRRPKKKTKNNKRGSIIEDCFDFCGFASYCN